MNSSIKLSKTQRELIIYLKPYQQQISIQEIKILSQLVLTELKQSALKK